MNEEENQQHVTVKGPGELWTDFLGYTSTNGIGHVLRWNAVAGKVVWYLITLAGFGALVWQTTELTRRYLRNDYDVSVAVEFNQSIPFPAVSICNMNPFRVSEMTELTDSDPDFGALYDDFSNDTWKRKRRKRSTPLSDEYYDDYWDNYEDNVDFYHYDNDYAEQTVILDYIASLELNVRKEVGHQLSSMLLECSFQGRTCAVSNFTQFTNYQYGNCFTFHQTKPNGSEQLFPALKPGPRFGLSLELFAELDEYMPDMAGGAGFRVVVHDQNKVPQPDDEGFDIPVGFYSNIGITRFENRRLGGKYYNCSQASTGGQQNIWANIVNNSYTQTTCMLSCYQVTVAYNCSCGDPMYPLEAEGLPAGLQSCPKLGEHFAECQQRWEAEKNAGTLECDCLPSCLDIQFLNSVSSSTWPIPTETNLNNYIEHLRDKGKPAIKKWLEKQNSNESSTYVSLADEVRYNVAKMTLAFTDLNYEIIYQTPKYTPSQFISEIGGQMGLWLGFSVITLTEYLELFCLLLASLCCSRSKRRQVDDEPKSKTKLSTGHF